jgi:pimeloyl-ACP methyl ester carboxylesterase
MSGRVAHCSTVFFEKERVNVKRMEVEVAGVPVTLYEVEGEGTATVLFLHGVGGTGKMWSLQMRNLRSFGCMLAVDLPGFAGAELPPSMCSLSDYAPLFVGLLDSLDIDRAVWVGNSLGGRIALEAALQAPERVSGLGLVCAAGIRLPDVQVVPPNSMAAAEFDKLVFYQPERYVSMQSEASRQATIESRALYERLVQNTELMDFQDRLGEIHVPTRVIWGRHDGVVPLPIGEAFARGISNAHLTVIEQAAHVPHVEQPQAVNRELALLLEEVTGRAESER